jgi:hypothetical protein
MAAIYRGVRFASRTASLWAAFFDHVGLKWRARPITISHWAPDFSLATPSYATSAYVHVVDARDRAGLVDAVAGLGIPMDLRSFLLLGRRPLGATVLGLHGDPVRGWQPAVAAAWDVSGHVLARWEALHPRPFAPLLDPPGTPRPTGPGALAEVLGGGELLPTWRERAESFAQHWATSEEVRDWGLIIQRLADLDELAAGALMGATRVHVGATRLEIDMADPSLRAAFCRQFTSRFRDAVKKALSLQLVVRYRPWRVA